MNNSQFGDAEARSLKVIGTSDLRAAVTVGGVATFNAIPVFATSVTFNGAVTFGSTSTFNGVPTFATSSTFNGPVTFGSTSTFNGPVTFGSTTTFNGAGTVNSTLTIASGGGLIVGTTAPTTFTANGTAGQIAIGTGATGTSVYLYVCHTANSWVRMGAGNVFTQTAFN